MCTTYLIYMEKKMKKKPLKIRGKLNSSAFYFSGQCSESIKKKENDIRNEPTN